MKRAGPFGTGFFISAIASRIRYDGIVVLVGSMLKINPHRLGSPECVGRADWVQILPPLPLLFAKGLLR